MLFVEYYLVIIMTIICRAHRYRDDVVVFVDTEISTNIGMIDLNCYGISLDYDFYSVCMVVDDI